MAGWRSTFAVGAAVVGLVAAVAPADAKPTKPTAPVISVLSSRADLVSDGQALVDVSRPAGTNPKQLLVTVNGRNVTKQFALRPNGTVEAVVTGLKVGRNLVVASYAGGRRAQISLTNHPRGGPLFTGPQLQPWKCQAQATDKQCNQPVAYTYLYKSTNASKAGLQPYNPASPPTDVAKTTTQTGQVVPFVVRQELGYRDRDQYKILTLFTPSSTWSRWSPPATWNHKVLVTGGGGCGGSYGAGNAPLADFSGTIPAIPGRDDSYVDALGMGFTVMTSALDNTGHDCSVAVEAEALMMVKEHLIEQYGDVRYTIGTGCSGGSIVQHTVANAYPGAIYDGLVVTCAYPDTFTAGAQFADYHLLRHYFESPGMWGTGVAWTPAQWAAVEGRPDPVNAIVADEGLFKGAINPIGHCVAANAYDPKKNPGGVRCDILDYMKTLLGPRPASVWSPMEKAVGHGFAGVPFSNVGIEYGLDALRQGVITPEMFVDLNEKIGGLDMNMQPEAKRLAGDDASVANAYRTGLVDETDNLDTVAIVDHAGPDPGAAHDYAHTWWIRDRLDRRHGNHANQVLWFGLTPLIGDVTWPTQALLAVDEWLAKVEADGSNRPLAQKIATDRPADVHDRCNTVPGVHLSATDGVCLPDGTLDTHYGTPREVAGGSNLNDVLKCSLVPLPSDGYGLIGLSSAQLDRLRTVFPDGVCDWGQRGIGQQPVVPWLTYQTVKGAVIYGGTAMPTAPRSKAVAAG